MTTIYYFFSGWSIGSPADRYCLRACKMDCSKSMENQLLI
ncbi:hypothetical protein NC652_010966 [Populus alba x Populus x berolinensis]|nr:hypothetical protein NC652_010966 [Populus alba x Populus x berolinensis]